MFEINIFLKLYIIPGVYRFVNFGLSDPGGHFCQKAGKNL